MVSLEQVKLLETKVAKAIDFVKSLSEENAALRGKLDGYRRRIDELEVLVKAFKEDQGRIEAGIMSALERLNQFEDAVEHGFSNRSETPDVNSDAPRVQEAEPRQSATDVPAAELPSAEPPAVDSDEAILAELEAEEAAAREAAALAAAIPDVEPAEESPSTLPTEEAPIDRGAELDIF